MARTSVVLPVPRSPSSVTTLGGRSRPPRDSPHDDIASRENSASGIAASRLAARAIHPGAYIEKLVPQSSRGLEVELLRGIAHLFLQTGDQARQVVCPIVRSGLRHLLLPPPRGAVILAGLTFIARVGDPRDESHFLDAFHDAPRRDPVLLVVRVLDHAA